MMSNWNLKMEMHGAHDYFLAASSSQDNTASRRSNKAKLSSASTPSGEPLILIADDSADDRALMSRALQGDDFRVAEAASCEETINAFLELQPQLVVLDILMPCIGGLGICRMLRAKPGGQDLKILMFSGLSDAGTIRRAFDAGVDDFLAKPNVAEDFSKLAERVRYMLFNKDVIDNCRVD